MNRRILSAGSQLAYRTGSLGALNRLRSRRGAVILAYHRIERDDLERQLKNLSRTHTITSLDDIVQRLREGSPTSGLAAITFDDGYANTVLGAAELTLRYGWPITIYLPTQVVSTGTPYWFTHIRLLAARAHETDPDTTRTVEIDGATVQVSFADPLPAIARLERLIFHRSPSEVEQHARSVIEQLGFDPAEPVEADGALRIVSWREVGELTGVDGVSFGAHTVSHPFLATLPDAAIEEEMQTSQSQIEEHVGRPVRHFCYPFGDPPSIGEAVPRIAQGLFESAVTMQRGRVTSATDRFLLPRVPIYDSDALDRAMAKIATA